MIDFLGIGAQKAGTTWIFEHLRQHPEISFPAGKETHFWDRHRDRGVDWWRRLFAADAARKQGEITPAYATLSTPVIREIASLLPCLRVFYSLRNPIARAWSSALMALERAEMMISEASEHWFIDHFNSGGSRSRGDYVSCITEWRSVFVDQQFLIVSLDDIASDPHGVLSTLGRHIGIDSTPFRRSPRSDLERRVFSGPGYDIPQPHLAFLRTLYAPSIHHLSELVDRDFSRWLEWDGRRQTEHRGCDQKL
jgi:hypothetical protein